MRAQRRKDLDLLNPLVVLVSIALALLLGFSPLLGAPGAESACIFGVVLAPLVFLASVRRAAVDRPQGFSGNLFHQVLTVAISVALFCIIVWIQSLATNACVGERSFWPFVVSTLPVLLLNTALGLHCGRLFNPKWLALAVGAAFWVVYLSFSFWEWHEAPSFRFASQLLGVLSGDLFQGLKSPLALYPYRLATVGYVATLTGIGLAAYPRENRSSLSSIAQRQRRVPLWIAPVLVVSVWLDVTNQDQLVPSPSSLVDAYSFSETRGAITVHADPNGNTRREVEAILAEAVFWHERIKTRLGLKGDRPIHVWLHANDRARGKWTGAHHVDFALPWRGELHVADAVIPHPSLGHELVHVMGAELNDNLFSVPSRWGLWVNPGLTEGLAMAVTPELSIKNDLTLKEQAAAMLQLGTKLPVQSLFSFSGFWQQAPARAYTLAGALTQRLLEAENGLAQVKEMYRTGDVIEVLGGTKKFQGRAQQFEKKLLQLELPEHALGVAAKRFARKSILKETCDPDRVERARKIRAALATGDLEKARELAQAVEPKLSPETRAMFARALAEQKHWEDATHEAAGSAEALPKNSSWERGRRWIFAGDLAWKAGDEDRAAILWGRAARAQLPPSWARLAAVKSQLVEALQAQGGQLPLARHALDYLLTVSNAKPDAVLSLNLLERALQNANDRGVSRPLRALIRYLIARQFVQKGLPDEGVLQMLSLAENHRADLEPSIYLEVLKGLAEAHLRRGDFAVGRAGYEVLLKQAKNPAKRIQYQDRMQRAARAAANQADECLLGLSARGGY